MIVVHPAPHTLDPAPCTKSTTFFVINERRDSDSGDLIDRALIAKMTYMVAL